MIDTPSFETIIPLLIILAGILTSYIALLYLLVSRRKILLLEFSILLLILPVALHGSHLLYARIYQNLNLLKDWEKKYLPPKIKIFVPTPCETRKLRIMLA